MWLHFSTIKLSQYLFMHEKLRNRSSPGKFCWQTGELYTIRWIRSVLKVVYFLRTVWGYISPFPYTTWPKARYQKNPKSFTYYSRTITNLIKFDFPLPRDQTLRCRICQMIDEKFKCVTFKAALDDVRYL
jgi:hypothetical protein